RHHRRGPAHREVLRGGRVVPLKQYKATSPVRRFRQSASFEELTKGKKPERSLTERKLRHAGRNAQGRVTTRHRGGGEKRNYRMVDFKRDKDGIPAKVTAIEYDPNRSARLALIVYRDGEKRYIIAPNDLRVGGAGHKRHMGWRPAVRGVVMSPRDHPHGGGEAKSPVGGQAQTPWGKPAMGLKTRNNPRTDRFVTERPPKRKSK